MVPRTLDEQVAVDRRALRWPPGDRGGRVDGRGGRLRVALALPVAAGLRTTVEDSVYLLDDYQGRGIGRLLLEELLRLAAAHGFHSVIARIAGENEASIALHSACGFEIVGTEREVGRKFGQWLDVVEMQRML